MPHPPKLVVLGERPAAAGGNRLQEGKVVVVNLLSSTHIFCEVQKLEIVRQGGAKDQKVYCLNFRVDTITESVPSLMITKNLEKKYNTKRQDSVSNREKADFD